MFDCKKLFGQGVLEDKNSPQPGTSRGCPGWWAGRGRGSSQKLLQISAVKAIASKTLVTQHLGHSLSLQPRGLVLSHHINGHFHFTSQSSQLFHSRWKMIRAIYQQQSIYTCLSLKETVLFCLLQFCTEQLQLVSENSCLYSQLQ